MFIELAGVALRGGVSAVDADEAAKDEGQEGGLELIQVGSVANGAAVVVEGDVAGDEIVAEGGEGRDEGKGVVVVEVRGFAAKGEVRGGKD